MADKCEACGGLGFHRGQIIVHHLAIVACRTCGQFEDGAHEAIWFTIKAACWSHPVLIDALEEIRQSPNADIAEESLAKAEALRDKALKEPTRRAER